MGAREAKVSLQDAIDSGQIVSIGQLLERATAEKLKSPAMGVITLAFGEVMEGGFEFILDLPTTHARTDRHPHHRSLNPRLCAMSAAAKATGYTR